MLAHRLTTSPHDSTSSSAKPSWAHAYLRFLLSRNENTLLKIAPLALVGILPIELVSNLVPMVGELDDIGYVIIAAVVLFRTALRVRRYR